jgi:hypothetical protein
MNKPAFTTKYFKVLGIAFLLLFAGVSCSPQAPTPAATPLIQVVQVNREVTRIVVLEVTREITREVVQTVEIPVTLTPSLPFTATPASSPTGTAAPTSAASPTSLLTPVPAAVTIQIHTQCLYGPDSVYLGRYDILASSQQLVVGRNLAGTWLEIQGADHKYSCWVNSGIVELNSGSLNAQLVVDPVLSPFSTLYPPPSAVSANRVGNDVTVFWQPVDMTAADYHGYLIEARVCQGGKQVFVPKAYVTSFDKNSTMLALKITDEPGCDLPSSAHIHTVNNQGYSTSKTIPWPAP